MNSTGTELATQAERLGAAKPVRSGAWLGAVQIRASRRSHENPGAERSGRSSPLDNTQLFGIL